MIRLFDSNDTSFTTNGLGTLSEATSCIITEELNGAFELELKYPITGKRYNDISLRKIIVAKSNPYSNPQPFRIYNISKPINGHVTISAEHLSYDLSGYPVQPFTATSVSTALTNLKNASIIVHPYTFRTFKTNVADIAIEKPISTRSVLGKEILELYQGEFEFDGYLVKLWEQRGRNRGVSIRYGKNLTDLTQEENCSSVYTAVYPYWYSENEGLIQLPERYLLAPGDYDFARILPLDLTSEFDEPPTEEAMRTKTQYYMQINGIGVPRVSLTVSFALLSQSSEYQNYALLETVLLGDTVTVEFPRLNVDSIARCVKTIYNVLTSKYDKVELGYARSNIASTITAQSQAIGQATANVPSKSFVRAAIDNATKLITGASGGHVVLHSSTEGGPPEEILIMDTDNITTATKVWRWNSGGLGYSGNGYSGEYALAMTMDGAIVASMITSGKIQGSQIQAGSITTNELSLAYKGEVSQEIVNKIEAFEDGLSLSVTNGTNESTIKLMSGSLELASKSITFSGTVMFSDLSTPGMSIVTGDNILTGTMSADRIGSNNGQYITLKAPLLLDSAYPEISGISMLYFGGYDRIEKVNTGVSPAYGYLNLYSYDGVHISGSNGLITSKIRSEGNISIDAYDNSSNDYTIYIGTAKVSKDGYAIDQKITIGNDSGTSILNLYGSVYCNTYPVLTSNNIGQYVVFQ